MKHLLLILFSIIPMLNYAQSLNITSGSETYESVENYVVNMSGTCELHLNGSDPINGATIKINSEDAWIYFHGVRPSYVVGKLSQFTINGTAAVNDDNIRIQQYGMGAVVIPHATNYAGATLYKDANFGSFDIACEAHTFYKGDALSILNNNISSFKLKKGYMMTIAQEENGTGYSKNYVADEADIEIAQLPSHLDDAVSFVRVVRWNWPTKKGFTYTDGANTLEASWYYDWSANKSSTENLEFVPMKWSGGDGVDVFCTKKNVTHQLGYNEPSHSEQSNISIENAIKWYPSLLATGLRAGSPNIADDGKTWLYAFMDECEKLNYRVDFIGVHWYQGGKTPKQFYDFIKDVHVRTGRPIWVTEWNNGAGWTCCEPTLEENAVAMAGFLHMLDTTSFVERYAIFNWVGDTRALLNGGITPAGEVYRDKESPLAYNSSIVYEHPYVELPYPIAFTTTLNGEDIELTWRQNIYGEDGFSIERSIDGGPFEIIATTSESSDLVTTYTDLGIATDLGKYTYRVRAVKGSEYSAFSEEKYVLLGESSTDVVYIQHNSSGKKLRATDESDIDLTVDTEQGDDVKWAIIQNTDGTSYIENIMYGQRLHCDDSSDAELVSNVNTGTNVKWMIETHDGIWKFIESSSTEKNLHASSSESWDVTVVSNEFTGANVQWTLISTGDTYSAIEEVASADFEIYPNPADDILYIKSNKKISDVKILDLSGRIIIEQSQTNKIDISNLQPGIYMAKCNENKTIKFIKR